MASKPPKLQPVVFDAVGHPLVFALRDDDGYYYTLNVQRTFSRYNPSAWLKKHERNIRASSIRASERPYFERTIRERNETRRSYR
jgi:hypothetical protein